MIILTTTTTTTTTTITTTNLYIRGLAKCITKPDQTPYTLANTIYYTTIILY